MTFEVDNSIAYYNREWRLDKEATSHNNLMGALRMSLQSWHSIVSLAENARRGMW